MPKILKLSSSSSNTQYLSNSMENESTEQQFGKNDETTSKENAAPSPKHIPFPDVPSSSELMNEFIMFLFALFSAGMQFLHIYRTAWWFPESHVNHAINFYLIDLNLVIFITVIISRRILYVLLNKFLLFMFKSKNLKVYKILTKCTFSIIFAMILGNCIMKIFAKHNYLCFFLLLYPIVVYFLIFGPQMESFLRMIPETETTYINNIPMHSCSTNSISIRDEIEQLKNDFNNRFKQVIFTSLINAYYSGFVPCFFAQNFIYYNITWATQHIIFVWFGGFMMCTVFCFPAKYCDIMHRAALHLGKWQRIDGRINITQAPATWSKQQSWQSGCIVRYSGDLYRSIGPITTSIPGNYSHYRFQRLFQNPSYFYMILSTIQIILVIIQITLLCFTIEWHHILSLSFLTLTNHHTLFQIVRDYFVTQKVYAAESSIYEKLSTHFN